MAARDGTARVKIKVEDAGTKRALEGASRAARKANEESQRSDRQTVDKAIQEAKRREKETRKALERDVEATKRAEREKQEAAKETTREVERQATRQRDASGRFLKGGGGGGGAGPGASASAGGSLGNMLSNWATGITVAGTLGTAISALDKTVGELVGAMRSKAGIKSLGEGLTSAQDFTRDLTQLGQEAFGELGNDEFNAKIDGTRQRLLEIANLTNRKPGELLEGLAIFQTEFSKFDEGVGAMEDIARAAQATGTPIQELAQFLGEVSAQFGVPLDQANELLAIMQQQGEKGAIAPKDFAANFSGVLGEFAAVTGRSGPEAFREFGSIAQVLRQGGFKPADAATRASNLFTGLSRVSVQEELAKKGVFVRDFEDGQRTTFAKDRRGDLRITKDQLPRGAFRNTADIMADIDRLGLSGEQLQDIFPDLQARQAVVALTAPGRVDSLRDIQAVDAARGKAKLAEGFARIESTASAQVQRQGTISDISQIENEAPLSDAFIGGLQLGNQLQRESPVTADVTRNLLEGLPLVPGLDTILTGVSNVARLLSGGDAAQEQAIGSGALGAFKGAINLDTFLGSDGGRIASESQEGLAKKFARELRNVLTDGNELASADARRAPRP